MPTIDSDVRYVLDHPWEVTALELRSFNVRNIDVENYMRELCIAGNCHTILADSVVVAVCGAERRLPGLWRTTFLASDELPTYAMAVVRTVRQLLEEGASKAKAREVEALSGVSGPLVNKWFRALGMRRDVNYDGGRVSRYVTYPR